MRPSILVAGAALTAALALVALPGLVGSQTPRPTPQLETAAFQSVLVPASTTDAPFRVSQLDAAYDSADVVDGLTTFIEPGVSQSVPSDRVDPNQPGSAVATALKPPKRVMRGYATFYDAGYTAMRLPRGTIIRVCGQAGCIERVVNDYGPSSINGRIIDLYRPDFFRICGCASWSGTTYVSVSIY